MKDQKPQTGTTVQKGEPVRPDPDMERTIDPTKTKHEHEKEEKEKKTPETGGMPGQEPVKPPMSR